MSHKKFDTYIVELGILTGKVDHYLYFKHVGDHFIYVTLYINDVANWKQQGYYQGG